MSRSAGISGLAKIGAAACLLALTACSKQDEGLTEQLAAAEAAAAKAVEAQKAAEKAAALAVTGRPAPPAPEPTVMAETPNPGGENDDDPREFDHESSDTMFGGEDQTVSPDGVVIPGVGA